MRQSEIAALFRLARTGATQAVLSGPGLTAEPLDLLPILSFRLQVPTHPFKLSTRSASFHLNQRCGSTIISVT